MLLFIIVGNNDTRGKITPEVIIMSESKDSTKSNS
jgi:hypothetical protein